MYYPDISDVPSEPLDLTAVKADVIWAVLPKSGASSFGIAATLGMGLDGVGNIGLIYADKQGNINVLGGSLGFGGNTGANADISMFYNSMPNASSVNIYEGYTVNTGVSAGEGIGGAGEVNITRDSETNQPILGYTTALGLSAKVNVPVPPVELYGNVTRTWLSPLRFNLYDSWGVPRPVANSGAR